MDTYFGQLQASTPNLGLAILVNQLAFQLPAKSLMRLKVATQAVEYYIDTSHPLTATGMLWTSRLCNFQAEKESLDEMKKEQQQPRVANDQQQTEEYRLV